MSGGSPAGPRSAAAARGRRPAGHAPAAAVLGDTDAGVLRAAGWQVLGRLAATPYADPRDAPGYLDLDELTADPRLDAVLLDGAVPRLAGWLPALRDAGLLVLLAGPAPLDVAAVQRARAADGPDLAVGLLQRWEPWAVAVARALPLAGGPVLQGTVRGWPRGDAAAAELADLVTGWCGEVVAVAAAPEVLPSRTLPPRSAGGAPAQVAWALLAASGATVLVSSDPEPDGPVVRLSFASARLEAGPAGARWLGGAEIPLPPVPDRRPRPLPVPPGTPPGLLGCAYALLGAVGGGDLAADDWPWPADLGALLGAAQVLAALRRSAQEGTVVRTG